MRKTLLMIFCFLILWSSALLAETFGPNVRCSTQQVERMAVRCGDRDNKALILDQKKIKALKTTVMNLQQQIVQDNKMIQDLLATRDKINAALIIAQQTVQVYAKAFQKTNQQWAQHVQQLQRKLQRMRPEYFSHLVRQVTVNTFLMGTQTGILHAQGYAFPRVFRIMSFQPVLIGAIMILLFLLIFFLIPWRKRTEKFSEKISEQIFPQEDDPFDESDALKKAKTTQKTQNYEYLSGEDVVASKLDLGKAFIEMGNAAHAKQVLDSVVEEGDEEQKAEALKLLKKIK